MNIQEKVKARARKEQKNREKKLKKR